MSASPPVRACLTFWICAYTRPRSSVNRGSARVVSWSRSSGRSIARSSATTVGDGGQHDHPLAEVDRLVDVVGDEQQGHAEALPHRADQVLEVGPGLRVDRRERLVHQQHPRLVGDGAGDRDPLLHAAGELPRVGGVARRRARPRPAPRRPAPRRAGLGEPLAPAAAARRSRAPAATGTGCGRTPGTRPPARAAAPVDRPALDAHLAGGRRQQAGDAAQQRGLAAAGRADDADELARGHGEGQVADRLDPAAVRVVDLAAGRGPRASTTPRAALGRADPWYQPRTRRSTSRKHQRQQRRRCRPSSSTPLHISGIWKPRWNCTIGEAEAVVGGEHLADHHQDDRDRQRLPGAGRRSAGWPRAARGAAAAAPPPMP